MVGMRFGSTEFRQKYDFVAQLTPEDGAKICRQVSFYFSDSNIGRDDYLLREVVKSKREGHDGAVELATIARFQKMRELLAPYGGYDNFSAMMPKVAEALSQSDIVEACENGTRVKRKSLTIDGKEPDFSTDEGMLQYRQAMMLELDKRYVFASPFSRHATMDSIRAFFDGVGQVKSIRLRRHTASKDFRGSVFVEFATEEEARRVAARADLVKRLAILTHLELHH